MELLLILSAIPALLGAGYLAHAVGILPPARRRTLNAVAYYVALPALLFSSTADRDLAELVSLDLVVGVPIAMGLVIAIAWFVHRETADPARRSVAIVQSYHTNFGYLGVPLVAVIFGDDATARAAMILGIGAIVQISATITLLSTLNRTGGDTGYLAPILVNPIMVALFVGFGASALRIPVPTIPGQLLAAIGELALPLALLCTGATLTLRGDALDLGIAWRVVGIKVLVMPALTLGTFRWLGADVPTLRAAVLMFAMPTAVSTYVFAEELGGDRHVASFNVFATTVVATGTLFAVVWVLLALS